MGRATNDGDEFTRHGAQGLPLDDVLVIDSHGHLGIAVGMAYVDSSPDSLVAAMDRLGIDKIHLSSSWANKGQARLGNDQVLAAMRRYPGRIYGYMVAPVGYAEQIIPELERCYAVGFRAVKVWSYGNRPGLPYDHPNYRLVFDYAEERGLPVLAHTWGNELDELDAAFQRYYRIRWILAHTGCRQLDKYVRAARTFGQVYLETCLSACPRGLIERLVAEVPLEKILWGSDQPYLNAANQLGRVLFARISPEAKRAILGANALRVLGSIYNQSPTPQV